MNRTVRIFDLLASNKSMKISLLAELLDVSQVTLRRDLDRLEKKGIINRYHGYVGLEGADDTGRRIVFNYLLKRRIARKAAQTIEEGETIMIESGSCCALFAEELAFSGKNATIITNSAFIANYVGKLPNIKIILLGGYFQPDSKVLVGPVTAMCSKIFYSDKFFIGVNGFIPEYGFTGSDYFQVYTAAELIKCVNRVFILTEAAKFNHRGSYNLISFDKLTGIFTDEGIPEEAEAALLKNKVELYKVSSAEEKIKWRQFPGQPPFLYKDKED